MSNTRKLKPLNRTSGLSQRPKQTWAGQLGNPTFRRRLALEQRQTASARKFTLKRAESEVDRDGDDE